MSITTHYSISCSACSELFYIPGSGEWLFETTFDAFDYARREGWSINEEVLNGSLWDFCPKCLGKRVGK